MTAAPWLGRYADLLPIRAEHAFHVLRAKDEAGAAVVLVMASPKTERELAERALASLADAHSKIDHEGVPRTKRVVQAEDGRSVVEFACDAVVDGAEALRLLADSSLRVPYAVADTFLTSVRKGLDAGHAAGFTLGRIAYNNMLFSADGRVSVFGFGHNVVVQRENGALTGVTGFQTSDVAAGAAPTPLTDYLAMLQMGRSIVAHVDMLDAVARVLRGVGSLDLELLRLMRKMETQIYVSSPAERLSKEDSIATSAAIRERLGVVLDVDACRAFFAAVVASGEEKTAPIDHASTKKLEVGGDAAWFSVGDGSRQQLGARKALRRVLLALVDARRHNAESTLSVWQLFAAGWPGEEPIYEAAVNRVYVTVARLRGLGVPIERYDDGYRVPPSVEVQASR